MKTSELKGILSQKIDKIEDNSFLEALITIVDARINQETVNNINGNGKNKIASQNSNKSKNNEVDDSENDSLKWLYDR